MENSTSNNLVKTLTEKIPGDLSSFEPGGGTTTTVDSDSSIFSKFSTWIVIIFILAFLGFNVFLYLAKGTQSFTDFMAPYLNYFGISVFKTTKQVVETSAKGLTAAGNVLESELKRDTMDKKQIQQSPQEKTQQKSNNLGTTSYDYKKENDDDKCVIPKKNSLLKALDNAAQTSDYMADDALSSIQKQSKTKWCYIGEEKGVRNCVKLSESQKCMSGDIFPSSNICINPNLRSRGK